MGLPEVSELAILVRQMEECVFCKIVKKEVPAEIVKETEKLLVFKDINPKAPIHLLLVPKAHRRDITEVDGEIWSEVREAALAIAKEKNLKGFRLVHNVGEAAIVPHMHVHLLGDVSDQREV